MTKQDIENLGWKQLEDRGMAENNGEIYVQGDWELRIWKTFPRFDFEKNGKTVFSSHVDYPVDPKHIIQIPQVYLANRMREYGII